MATLNRCEFIARIGADPKISYGTSGTCFADFSIAVDESYKNRETGQKVEQTEWVRCKAFRNQAEFIGKYLGKGRLVHVVGKWKTDKWQDQNGQDRYTTYCIVMQIQGLDPKPQNQQGQNGGYQQQGQGGYQGQPQQQQYNQQQRPQDDPDDLGPAFPSEASGMDEVPF